MGRKADHVGASGVLLTLGWATYDATRNIYEGITITGREMLVSALEKRGYTPGDLEANAQTIDSLLNGAAITSAAVVTGFGIYLLLFSKKMARRYLEYKSSLEALTGERKGDSKEGVTLDRSLGDKK